LTEKNVVALRGTPPGIGRVCISPDGNLLAVSGWRREGKQPDPTDYYVGIWDWRRAKLVHKLIGHTDGIGTALFSPCGKNVLSGGLDGSLRIWNARTGTETTRVDAHEGWICHLQICPSGKQVLSCGHDGLIKFWDVESKQELGRFVAQSRVVELAVSADGRRAVGILAGSGFRQAADGSWSNPGGGLIVLDIELRRIHKQIDSARADLGCVAIDAPGKRVLTGDNIAGDQKHRITLWDLDSGRELGSQPVPGGGVRGVSFVNDGKIAVAVDRTGGIVRWELPQ
jgi:WD40 repeat protein